MNHGFCDLWRPKMYALPHIFAHPARVGRQVSCGLRQSIPSSMYAIFAAEIDTRPQTPTAR